MVSWETGGSGNCRLQTSEARFAVVLVGCFRMVSQGAKDSMESKVENQKEEKVMLTWKKTYIKTRMLTVDNSAEREASPVLNSFKCLSGLVLRLTVDDSL